MCAQLRDAYGTQTVAGEATATRKTAEKEAAAARRRSSSSHQGSSIDTVSQGTDTVSEHNDV